MSFYEDDDEFDDGSGRRNPLRETVNKLEKRVKDLEKDLQTKDDELGKERKTNRQRSVADVLKDKGANPALARYVLQDVDDPTPESVASWLTDNGELFGYKPTPTADPAAAMGLPAGTALPPDLVAAYQAFQQSQSGGTSAPQGSDAAVAAKLNDPNLTQAELLNLIAGAGN